MPRKTNETARYKQQRGPKRQMPELSSEPKTNATDATDDGRNHVEIRAHKRLWRLQRWLLHGGQLESSEAVHWLGDWNVNDNRCKWQWLLVTLKRSQKVRPFSVVRGIFLSERRLDSDD